MVYAVTGLLCRPLAGLQEHGDHTCIRSNFYLAYSALCLKECNMILFHKNIGMAKDMYTSIIEAGFSLIGDYLKSFEKAAKKFDPNCQKFMYQPIVNQ